MVWGPCTKPLYRTPVFRVLPPAMMDSFSRGAMKTLAGFALFCVTLAAQSPMEFPGAKGPGRGKHIVLIAADQEYRSEESIPALARILAERHGFRCTVLFTVDPATGRPDPNAIGNLPGLEALRRA